MLNVSSQDFSGLTDIQNYNHDANLGRQEVNREQGNVVYIPECVAMAQRNKNKKIRGRA